MELKSQFIFVLLLRCYVNGRRFSGNCGYPLRSWICCEHYYEEINGVCIACTVGYFSEFGEPCQKCPYGLYGRKCVEICKCKDTESCHHVEGCIKNPGTTVIVETELSTANDIFHDRFTNATISPNLSVTSHEGDNYTTGSSLPSLTIHEENSFLGLSKRELVVYSMCIGGFTCLLLLLFFRGRCTLKIHRKPSVLLDSEYTRNNVPVRLVSVGYTEGIYETIDEFNMMDAPLELIVPVTVETISSDESTDSERSQSLLNNEYLNPYQPMVPDPERHVYDFITYSMEDYSESPESKADNSGYWNPSYQQAVPYSAHQNVLSIKADVYRSGASTPDENEKKNEYRHVKDLKQIEYVDETSTEQVIHNPPTHHGFKGSFSNNEMELKRERTIISNVIHVDDINNSLPVDVSDDDVPRDEATNIVSIYEAGEFKPK